MKNGGLRTKEIRKVSTVDKPLITVLTVVYNGADTLEQTIQSVVNQTYDNVEYLIIDGASTDSTLDIIKKYEDEIDYWQSEPDKGIYNAMNKGVKFANGDFLFILGADDTLFNNNVFSVLVSKITNLSKAYYGDVYNNYTRLLNDYTYSLNKMLIGNMCQQSIFYPKKFYSNHTFNEKYRLFSDWEYNFHLWKENDLVYIPITVANYSGTGASTNTQDENFHTDKDSLIKKIFGHSVFYKYKLSCVFSLFTRCIYMVQRMKNRKRYKSIG